MQTRLINKKLIITIVLIITSPLWLYLIGLTITFILNLGRYVGTFMRLVYSLSLCI